jgi:hypothetical protein
MTTMTRANHLLALHSARGRLIAWCTTAHGSSACQSRLPAAHPAFSGVGLLLARHQVLQRGGFKGVAWCLAPLASGRGHVVLWGIAREAGAARGGSVATPCIIAAHGAQPQAWLAELSASTRAGLLSADQQRRISPGPDDDAQGCRAALPRMASSSAHLSVRLGLARLAAAGEARGAARGRGRVVHQRRHRHAAAGCW